MLWKEYDLTVIFEAVLDKILQNLAIDGMMQKFVHKNNALSQNFFPLLSEVPFFSWAWGECGGSEQM